MFSSVMPGSVPQTFELVSPSFMSTDSFIFSFTGWPAPIRSRITLPSLNPMKKPGVVMGRCWPGPPSPWPPSPCQTAKLSEMPYTTPIAAAPFSAARAMARSYAAECPIDPGAGIE